MTRAVWIMILLKLLLMLKSISAQNFTLTLLHTGRMASKFEARGGKHGIARVIHFVNTEKASWRDVIYLDTMDCFFGSFFFDVHRWKICAAFLKLLPSDVHGMGEKEMIDGNKGMRERNLLSLLKALNKKTIVCCNCQAEKDPNFRPYIKKSTVLEVLGRRIGVTGYIANGIIPDKLIGKMTFTDDVAAVRKEASKFKAEGINIVIVIAHSDKGPVEELVRRVRDVDIVVGGHDSYFFYNGKPPVDVINHLGDYPTLFKDADDNQVLSVRAGRDLYYVGKLQVTFDNDGKAIHWSGNCIHMSEYVIEDPEALKLLNKFRKKVEEEEKKVIAKTRVPMPLRCQWRECNLGNLITDSFVWYNIRYPPSLDKQGSGWATASISLINIGAMKAGVTLNKLTNNSIREVDAMSVLPSNDYLFIYELRGHALQAGLEEAVSSLDVSRRNNKFLQMSGLKVVYDMSKPNGSRVESLRVRCKHCETPQYEPIDSKRIYRVIMSTHIAHMNPNYPTFNNSASEIHAMSDSDAIIFKNHIKLLKTIQIGEEERIIVKNCPDCFDETVEN